MSRSGSRHGGFLEPFDKTFCDFGPAIGVRVERKTFFVAILIRRAGKDRVDSEAKRNRVGPLGPFDPLGLRSIEG